MTIRLSRMTVSDAGELLSLQEARNIHLYEKMGYHATGQQTVINDCMTIVEYVK